MFRSKIIIFALLTLILTACAKTTPASNGQLNVVATTAIIGDIARNIGGDAINLTVLFPNGTDPHSYSPTPQDMTIVSGADIVFMNGFQLEAGLGKTVLNTVEDATIVEVSDGITPLAADPNNDADEGGVDPHTWTSPVNGIIFAKNIEAALSTANPARADTFRSNAAAYITRLQELDGWVQAQINTIPPENRTLVTDHAVFGYYVRRYGLKQVGTVVPGFSTAAQPSAQELAALQQTIEQYHVKAIFVGTTANPTVAEQIAQDTGIKIVRLYTGTLGEPGSGAETYIDYIRFDTTAIVNALR